MTLPEPEGWHGTADELGQLRRAMIRHCSCPNDGDLPTGATCSVHAMLDDQRTLDHLLFAYRVRERFAKAEWTVQAAEDFNLPKAA
jgi:hypothetical protein